MQFQEYRGTLINFSLESVIVRDALYLGQIFCLLIKMASPTKQIPVLKITNDKVPKIK